MNTKAAVVAAFMLFALAANAGPFGIDPGDPINAEGVDDLGFIFEEATVSNTGGFDSITKYGVPGIGTCIIVAYNRIASNNSGSNVLDNFYYVKDKLVEKYGEPTSSRDTVEPYSEEASLLILKLKNGTIEPLYQWTLIPPQDNIQRILLDIPYITSLDLLGILSISIRLQYDFDNMPLCDEAIEQVF